MHLEDYCSEYVKKIYNICGCLNGEYVGKYLYSLNNNEDIDIVDKAMKDIAPSNDSLCVDSGFVCDFKYKECEGYVVVQSLYNKKYNKLSDVLRMVADYIDELKELEFKEIMLIDNYAEYGETLYSFDICFILTKEKVKK